MRKSGQKPELLAPAGDYEAMRAAAANGADAVYFGLQDFNARRRATNFSIETLSETMAFLHDRNIRGYVTFNTLIFSDELPRAEAFLKSIAQAGADAVIIQDLGLIPLIRRLAPTLPIHASTQMTLSEPRAINLMHERGIQRVILPRELSLDDIALLREHTEVELEVFVHGALCISWSGQCLASESFGGRSANRGLCAQPCRMEYDLIHNGHVLNRDHHRYPLSPPDLAAHGWIQKLVELGVRGFKIEGRLKGPEYVAAAVRVYRASIDAAVAGKEFAPDPADIAALEQTFSRGFGDGWLKGDARATLVTGDSPRKRGVKIGTVTSLRGTSLLMELSQGAAPISAGDGIVCSFNGREMGGRVYSVMDIAPAIQSVNLAPDSDIDAISAGAEVFLTDDPALRKRLAQSYARDDTFRRVPLNFTIAAEMGRPLELIGADDAGSARAVADQPLEAARKHPATPEMLREQLSRLGDTPFEFGGLRIEKLDAVMIPKSLLNDLRRRIIEALLQQRRAAMSHAISNQDALSHLRKKIPRRPTQSDFALSVLTRTDEQLSAVIESSAQHNIALVYSADLARVRDAGMRAGAVAPRVLKPGEERVLIPLLAAKPDTILARNLGELLAVREQAPETKIVADFTLNAANELGVDVLSELGASAVVPATDLTWAEMAAMLQSHGPEGIEIIAHQHVPLLHTDYCLFAAHTSSNGDCAAACRRERLLLRDRTGAEHLLLSDGLCRGTLYNAAAQSACELLPAMLKAGIRRFRIDLLDETGEQTRRLIEIYSAILSGNLDPRAAWRTLPDLGAGRIIRGTLQEIRQNRPPAG